MVEQLPPTCSGFHDPGALFSDKSAEGSAMRVDFKLGARRVARRSSGIPKSRASRLARLHFGKECFDPICVKSPCPRRFSFPGAGHRRRPCLAAAAPTPAKPNRPCAAELPDAPSPAAAPLTNLHPCVQAP